MLCFLPRRFLSGNKQGVAWVLNFFRGATYAAPTYIQAKMAGRKLVNISKVKVFRLLVALLIAVVVIFFGSQNYAANNPRFMTLEQFITLKALQPALPAEIISYDEKTISFKVNPWEYYVISNAADGDVGLQTGKTYWFPSWSDVGSVAGTVHVIPQSGVLLLIPQPVVWDKASTRLCFLPGMKMPIGEYMSYIQAQVAYEDVYVKGTWQDVCGNSLLTLPDHWFFASATRNIYTHTNIYGSNEDTHSIDGYGHFEKLVGSDAFFVFDSPRNISLDGAAVDAAQHLWATKLQNRTIKPDGIITACGFLQAHWYSGKMTLDTVKKLCPDFDVSYQHEHATLYWLYSDSHNAVLNMVLDGAANNVQDMALNESNAFADLQVTLTTQECVETDKGYVLYYRSAQNGQPRESKVCAPHGSYLTVDNYYQFSVGEEWDSQSYLGDYAYTYRIP